MHDPMFDRIDQDRNQQEAAAEEIKAERAQRTPTEAMDEFREALEGMVDSKTQPQNREARRAHERAMKKRATKVRLRKS